MINNLTIVMYHYVRNIFNSEYPNIKGLETKLFEEQVKFLIKNYNIISLDDIFNSISNKSNLPAKSCLLTFDDGYLDHYLNVFPILTKYKLSGVFFPPVKTVSKRKLLDVNKIHFILASNYSSDEIIDDIFINLNELRKDYSLLSNEFYFKKLAVPSRHDDEKVMFIKNILQFELESTLRERVVNNLFLKFLKIDEQEFANKLYMSVENIKEMHSSGMSFGSHGSDHIWLGKSSFEEQFTDIKTSLDFLLDLGISKDRLTMCYPYGSYNADTIKILNQFDFKLGFTTEVRVSNINNSDLLTLPRLDTNDLPKISTAKPNEWYNLA